MKKANITKADLEFFIASGKSQKDACKHFNIGRTTVINKCKEYGIKFRETYDHIFTKDFLELNTTPITILAKKYNCSVHTIRKYYKKYSVEYTKNQKAIDKLSNKEWLKKQYIDKNKTLTEISKKLKCGRERVKEWLELHKIKQKDRYAEKVWNLNIPIHILSSNKPHYIVASEYGCCEEYVVKLRQKYNIEYIRKYNTSYYENTICDLLNANNITFEKNIRSLIPPYEIDIYIPDYNIAIEINGVYWHNELNVSNNYHKMKRDMCEKIGVRLINFYEDDLVYRWDIIKNIILYVCGKSNKEKIYARKCIVVYNIPLKTRRLFLDKYHIQGNSQASKSLGLLYNDEIVAIMIFKGNVLARYATSKNVVGGFSRLVKHSNMDYIRTFIDYDTFNGGAYDKCGFKLVGKIPPDYKYVYNNKRVHKFNFRKSRFKNDTNLLFSSNMTEHELAKMNKIYRIYDSGKGIYEYGDNKPQ